MSLKFLMISLALGAAGCSSSSGSADDQNVTVVFGRVTGSDGSPVSGARVQGGGKSATTNSDGRYELKAGVAKRITVRFESEGHLPAFRNTPVLNEKPVALDATLVVEAAAQPLDAEAGGAIDGSRGARVVVPAGGLVGAQGESIGGMVDVHLTPLDPSNAAELTGATDEFSGRDASGEVTLLESFGMLDITIRQDGEKLQVAPGQSFEIRIPVPSGVTDPPATMPLWSLNEELGTWVQEGEATFNAAEGIYVGQIGHMSTWNCDQPQEATCITGVVKDVDGELLAGARITARGANYAGTSSAVAGEDARFYIAVRKDSDVSVLASHSAGGGTARIVRSGTEDTTIPPTPGDPRCLDVGEWVVERGVVRTSNGGTINCNVGQANPFAGTCAEEFFSVYQCYQPQGACTYTGGAAGSSSVRWANGVSYEGGLMGNAIRATYRGTNGQVCATATLPFNAETGEQGDFEFVLPNGRTFVLLIDENDTRFGMRCPNGQEVFFERADLEGLEACGVGGDDENNSISQCEGYPGGPGGGAGGGGGSPGQPTLCMENSECMVAGEICCQPDPNQAQGICFSQAICDQIREAQMNGN